MPGLRSCGECSAQAQCSRRRAWSRGRTAEVRLARTNWAGWRQSTSRPSANYVPASGSIWPMRIAPS